LEIITRQFWVGCAKVSQIPLKDYRRPFRQLVIADLGHEQPTSLLTNQTTRSAPKLIERYAQRMIIENNIAYGIDFFKWTNFLPQ